MASKAPIVHSYRVSTSNVLLKTGITAVLNQNTGIVDINFDYLINSFNAGTMTLKYKYKLNKIDSWSALANGKIVGESANSMTLKAKNRKIRHKFQWDFKNDLLPKYYAEIMIEVTVTDSDSNSSTANTTLTGTDARLMISNLQTKTHGTDTTPTMVFEIPMPKKAVNIAPVLEQSTNENLSPVDHTVTAFEYWNGSAWVAGNATNGVAVSTANVKARQVLSSVGSMDYWRIKLVPKSFV